MLETYAAYADYQEMATLTRELIQECSSALFGDHTARHHDGTEVDLSGEWPQVPLYELVSEAVGEELTPATPVEKLRALAERHDIGIDPAWLPGKVVEEIFEALVQPSLQAPTFVVDFPVDTSPLTRAHRSKPGLAEKWDLYILGVERATAYSELVDPVVQRDRFTAQAALAAAGDPEAMALDEDFLEALEYGMPPTGGMGMGIDRLMMTLTGLGIRETILFPLVRPIS
jgi:lysyl-tRNA synthetase class 2